MNLIDKKLKNIKKENRLGLMTHVVVGYPSLEATKTLVKVMEDAGADFIELQIPFTDPLADGPTIMRACEEALRNKTRVKDAFKLAGELSGKIKIPLLFMAYYNTVFKYGTKKFCQDSKKSGISGLIVPDIPLEEEHLEHFIKYCKAAELKNIRVVSPASTIDRLRKNAKIADGFVYCTARQGITGAKKELDSEIKKYLRQVKDYFRIPLAAGFGIGNKERVNLIRGYSDIVVIGSAIIDVINKPGTNNLISDVKEFLRSLSINT